MIQFLFFKTTTATNNKTARGIKYRAERNFDGVNLIGRLARSLAAIKGAATFCDLGIFVVFLVPAGEDVLRLGIFKKCALLGNGFIIDYRMGIIKG